MFSTTMAIVGLAFIVAGWYVQLAASKKKKFTLQKNFLLANVIGAGFLTLNSFGEFGVGTFLLAAIAVMVYLVMKRMGKK